MFERLYVHVLYVSSGHDSHISMTAVAASVVEPLRPPKLTMCTVLPLITAAAACALRFTPPSGSTTYIEEDPH